MNIIVIDPGHGGKDSGAIGHATKEKDINLSVALLLADKMMQQEKFIPVLTRYSDTFLSLADRVQVENKLKPKAFLSLHCNASTNKLATGIELWTSPGRTKADPLATKLYKQLQINFPKRKFRSDYADGDPDKEAPFTVLMNTIGPAVLIEMEFITSYLGEAFLLSRVNQDRMASAILSGLSDWS